MISKASIIIVNLLIKHSAIKEEDRELYQYGFFILMSQMLYFTITMVFGLLLGVFIESLIFYLIFQLIRRYAGGFHASTETSCGIMTTISLLISTILIRVSLSVNLEIPFLVAASFSAISICIFCPLESPEKPLTNEERIHFRKVTHIVLCLISLGIILSKVFKIEIILVPSCLSLILESILLIAGKVKGAFQKQKC